MPEAKANDWSDIECECLDMNHWECAQLHGEDRGCSCMCHDDHLFSEPSPSPHDS